MFLCQFKYFNSGVLLLLFGVIVLGCNAAASADEKELSGFQVRLVDEEGRPVAHADVGLYTYYGDVIFSETGWKYEFYRTSDEDGIVRFTKEDASELGYFALVARHKNRKLVAIESLKPSDCADLRTVRMHPECRVTGTLTCKQLETKGESLRGVNVNVFMDGKYAIEYWSNQSTTFEFVMPPGKYKFSACSDLSGTHEVVWNATVPAGKAKHDLGVIDLPLTRHKQLQGEKAPELCDVVAWKNSKPLTLSDLRGKVVLLEFWGWWCGACVSKMPELFSLHDKYHEDGLVIIAIHMDYTDEIDTVEKFDKKLAGARKKRWNGRDIPFPVALVLKKETPYPSGAAGAAKCEVAAKYGICRYPTTILIDREGRVVGRFRGTPDQIGELEKLLGR